ncbi:hypothetical protein O181_125513 [Austropuccinia psidii MF-1]|uniref:Uncharacterized protein n=1 Tax=Austropuccinia psidii MF-1 TaxID=1389203 RepID=A0A9Q3Q541_9BASI|nr:hypothetical protein [Austropuccinia psidii MF-1]
MSREDHVNLNSYANDLISSNFLFKIKIPLEPPRPIHLNSLNRLLPYLDAQELTIQGRGVLSQPRRLTLLQGCCGNSNLEPVGANWPHLVSYGQLVPSSALWPFGHKTFPYGKSWPPSSFMASGHILPSLASLANFHITNPQAFIF